MASTYLQYTHPSSGYIFARFYWAGLVKNVLFNQAGTYAEDILEMKDDACI